MADEIVSVESSLESFLDSDPTLNDEPEEQAEGEPQADSPEVEDPEGSEEPAEGESESEDDGEEEEAEEDGEEQPQAVSDDTLVDISIGGEEYEVNFAELKAGYLRQEDYATKVAALEAEALERNAKAEQLEAQLAEELQNASVMALSDANKYDQVNWTALKQQDPETYTRLRVEATEARERADAIIQRRNTIQEMHQKAQAIKHDAYLKGQVELAEKLIPGFREPEFFNKLVEYGKDVGYSKDDIMAISDARQLLLLNNARLHAESVVRKKAAIETKRPLKELPPVVKPGQTVPKSSIDRKVVKSASARLKSEKTVDAAAALLMTLDLN